MISFPITPSIVDTVIHRSGYIRVVLNCHKGSAFFSLPPCIYALQSVEQICYSYFFIIIK